MAPQFEEMVGPTSVLQSLPLQHRRFVEQYVIHFNAYRAAVAAGFSKRSARSQASRLLTKANIQAAVKALTAKASAKAELTVDRVVQEIARIAFCDARKLLDRNGLPRPVHQLDDDTAAALAGMDVLEEYRDTADGKSREFCGYVKKIKLADKNAALQMAGRYLKMFTDKVQVSGALTLEQAILMAHQRREQKQLAQKGNGA